ncbi:MAG: hypothetical protein COB81_07365, partial [Flavobacteriaceae bacterium]
FFLITLLKFQNLSPYLLSCDEGETFKLIFLPKVIKLSQTVTYFYLNYHKVLQKLQGNYGICNIIVNLEKINATLKRSTRL